MPTQNPEDSEEVPENSGSEEEPQSRNPISGGVAEYEKQRLSRIADNRARMEALGLPKIASSLWGSAQKVSDKKTKKKKKEKGKVENDGDDDDDYRPDEVEERMSSSIGEEANEDDYLGETSSGSRRKKVKTKGSKPKKKVPAQKFLSESDYIDDDDDALMQAIALSLQGSAGVSGVVHSGPLKCSEVDGVNSTFDEKKGASHIQEDTGKKKRKKSFSSRLQMTEDELVVHFFQFDDEWKGGITMRDIQRVAIAHDFMWTDKELADMIHCFDSDGDGKLSLDDFQKIAGRCNMIQGPESS